MTLQQMRYFVEVCHSGSVSGAAHVLHISQPSISSAIRELEREFGVALFHRIKMRLSLTHEGQYFLTMCSTILREADELCGTMRDFGSKRNQIRMGVPPMIGTFLFPSIFSAFHASYPDIEIDMAENGSLKIREMVEQEKLDIAIAVADAQRDVQFQMVPILQTTLLFCVDANHVLAQRSSIRLEDLKSESLLLFPQDFHQTVILNERFAQLGFKPKVMLESSQLYTIKKMIAGGQAGAFLFREIAAMEPELVGLPLEDPIDMEIYLVWKKGTQMYSDTIKLIHFVQHFFRENHSA